MAFEFSLLAGRLLSFEGKGEEARGAFVELLKNYPAEREPYLRARALRELLRCGICSNSEESEALRSEFEALRSLGGYDWLKN